MLSGLGLVLALGAQNVLGIGHSAWKLRHMDQLVTFGNSYTDESRLLYFVLNQEAPPIGWIAPENDVTSSGGRIWARYVSDYTGAELYNYAVSGATCSNCITPRYFGLINGNFPSVDQYEIPTFLADANYRDPQTGQPVLTLTRSNTVYAIWIGTNDLGNGAFIDDAQVAGKTLLDYVECIFRSIERLYDYGARYFVLMNVPPLDLLPLYALPEMGGVETSTFWPDKPANSTEVSCRMKQTVVAVNEIIRLKMEGSMRHRYKGASVALFDTHSLLTNIYDHPAQYFNGTEPPNVQSWVKQCDAQGQNCVEQPSRDSFMWYDAIHPSEQTDRIIAQHFVQVVKGLSPYTHYFE
ncbi:GDSL lipase/acylhydrolase [Histoplasma capsulatum H143]|uniref:GDSL lipase/acylhydrolase n=1 Tax=Ajellomyces capsulatus (strain H143) TaxID=544712 RepID=C6HS11_AJECH|nr:GDSL lipase/acylhydrolase [Histoplasma capsulatum H143]